MNTWMQTTRNLFFTAMQPTLRPPPHPIRPSVHSAIACSESISTTSCSCRRAAQLCIVDEHMDANNKKLVFYCHAANAPSTAPSDQTVRALGNRVLGIHHHHILQLSPRGPAVYSG